MAGYWWADSNSFYQLGQFFDFLKKAKQPGIPNCQMQLRKVFFFSNGWQSEFRRDVFFSRGLGFHTKKSQKKWIIHLIPQIIHCEVAEVFKRCSIFVGWSKTSPWYTSHVIYKSWDITTQERWPNINGGLPKVCQISCSPTNYKQKTQAGLIC